MASTVTISGAIFDPSTGTSRKTGVLYIRPESYITQGDGVVAPMEVAVPVPESGQLSFGLVPSYGGVRYVVEYDPDPTSAKPRRMKPGYFRSRWLVPTRSVTLAEL